MRLFDDGAVALVTGGNRGIGRSVAEVLAAEGVHVVLTFRRDEQEAKLVVERLIEAGGSAEAVALDVTDEQQVRAVFRHLRRTHGRLDAVVSNAGITRDGLMAAMSRGTFDDVVRTNLGGFFLVGREAVRAMATRRSGSIVAVGSMLARKGARGQANYVASKAGLVGMMQVLAVEAASYGVRVNVVSPGFVRTDMVRHLPEDKVADRIPLGRYADPAEIARLIAFVCSPAGSYLTGSDVVIDGGVHLL